MMRWFLGVVMGLIGFTMVVTLVPGPIGGTTGTRPDTVADVGGQEVTVAEVQRALQRDAGGRSIPPQIKALYTRQILDQLIYQRLNELEAKRLGIRVTDEERADEIKRVLPGAFAGAGVTNLAAYAAEVEQRFQMSVPEFEELLRASLVESKVRRLLTDGISVSPAEIEQEFLRKNEKVKLEYVVLKPSEMEAQVPVTDADLAAYFERTKAKYQLPERRSLRYILVDTRQLVQTIKLGDEELRPYYQQNLDRFKVQNRVHAIQIVLSTTGKTDAEVEEIRKKAEEVLAKVRKGGKFEDLAKQYSQDPGTKDKGGDLGWIVEGQTVPEFQKTAFGLAKGATSDLVKTQFGFHIIRVLDRETAHTQSFEEARGSILPIIAQAKAEALASEMSDKVAAAVRQSSSQPLEDIGKKFGLPVVEVPPVSITDPLGELGNSTDVRDFAFRARPGELSSPIHTDRGYAVVTVKEIQPGRQATLAEVRGKVEADFRAEKALDLVKNRAQELAEKAKKGEKLTPAAKALGLEAKTSDSVSRADSLPDVGSVRRLPALFTLPVGDAAPAFFLGSNWAVYRVLDHQKAAPEDLPKQTKEIEQQLRQSKEQVAYEAFRESLQERMTREGKLRINQDALKTLTTTR